MSVTVTNGRVLYGRTVKTGDYENKKGEVDLSFTVEEGSDPHDALHHVKKMAAEHLHHLLDVNAPKADPAIHNAPAAKVPAEKPKAAAPKMPAPKTKIPGVIPAAKEPAEAVEDASDSNEPEDSLDDLMGGDQDDLQIFKREITDKELIDATQRRMDQVKNQPAVRKLVNALGVKHPPGRLIDLPQDKRQAFLDGLLEIQPLA